MLLSFWLIFLIELWSWLLDSTIIQGLKFTDVGLFFLQIFCFRNKLKKKSFIYSPCISKLVRCHFRSFTNFTAKNYIRYRARAQISISNFITQLSFTPRFVHWNRAFRTNIELQWHIFIRKYIVRKLHHIHGKVS